MKGTSDVLEWVESQLAGLYSPTEAKLWLSSPHPLLDGDTPADRIKIGNVQGTLAIIDQLKSGAYV